MGNIGGKEKIDIIVVTYNRLNLLKKTIKAINVRTRYPHRIIVIDNNSYDGTKEWLTDLLQDGLVDEVIFLSENLGLGKSYQEGLKRVKSDYFVVCTDDVIPPKTIPCWLEREVITIKANPEYAGICMRGARITRFTSLDKDLL